MFDQETASMNCTKYDSSGPLLRTDGKHGAGVYCRDCPEFTCSKCGLVRSFDSFGCACGRVIDLMRLPLADVKAIFAADGTWNVASNGKMTLAERP